MSTPLANRGLAPHPDKTWVGKAERGVDFLGYRVSPNGIAPAPATVARPVTRLHRLQEQQGRGLEGGSALGAYVSRWWRWAEGGYPTCSPVRRRCRQSRMVSLILVAQVPTFLAVDSHKTLCYTYPTPLEKRVAFLSEGPAR